MGIRVSERIEIAFPFVRLQNAWGDVNPTLSPTLARGSHLEHTHEDNREEGGEQKHQNERVDDRQPVNFESA